MTSKRDYYAILGVTKDATREEIRRAYRKLALKFHPDRDKSAGAEERFKHITVAYQVLSDEQKRQMYDFIEIPKDDTKKIVTPPPQEIEAKEKSRYQIIVEPSLCLAFGSCETLAPKVFVIDQKVQFNPKAVVIDEQGHDIDTILDAAQTCPTRAIIIIDRVTGEQIYP